MIVWCEWTEHKNIPTYSTHFFQIKVVYFFQDLLSALRTITVDVFYYKDSSILFIININHLPPSKLLTEPIKKPLNYMYIVKI